MSMPMDLDALLVHIAAGETDDDGDTADDGGSVGKMSADGLARLEAEFNYALRNDSELMIDIAKAASAAAERRDELQEQARVASDPATPPEEAERLRASLDRW